ncbi:MAG: putative lipoic acid-binding regulatory protein [Chlamydiales bacterium]|jgi:putative lipoic acid-binding regulatory protein
MDTPDIQYPCPWDYQIIGANEERLRGAVTVILEDKYVLTLSNRSKNMRYCSMQLTVEVRDDDHRLSVFDGLRRHADILFVL